METLIDARGLRKKYGEKEVIKDISFSIEAGKIIGLIGPNGAGKTTTLNAILGLTDFEGQLNVMGIDPRSGRHNIMEKVSFISDVASLPRWMKVTQLLDYVEGVHPRFIREQALTALARTSILPLAKISTLSKGMIVQLHLAIIMAIDVPLLVLDEPTLGLDLIFRKQFYDQLLNDYFDEDKTIIITTHQVEEIEYILTDVMFIRHGKLVLNSSMDGVAERYCELIAHPDCVEQARALGPINSRTLLNKQVFLFEDVARAQLEEIGECHTPGVADLFVAKMTGDWK